MWYCSVKYTLDFGNDAYFSFIRHRKISVLKWRSSLLLTLHVESILFAQMMPLHARSIIKEKELYILSSDEYNHYVFYKQK